MSSTLLRSLASCLLVLVSACRSTAVDPAPPQPTGWLLIVGGGGTTPEMYERMLGAAGGKDSKVVILPQASESSDTGASSVETWKKYGATNVEWLDLKDPARDAQKIRAAAVIWFPGGVQTRLMKALHEAGVAVLVRQRFQAGAVIGGTSAGAAVMSDVMITGDYDLSFKDEARGDAAPGPSAPGASAQQTERAGTTVPAVPAGSAGAANRDAADEDSGLKYVRVGTNVFSRGLALMPGAIVDQHFVRRQRFNRLLSAVLEHPQLVGIGIDEKTSILVHGTRFEVVGVSNVVVVDARGSETGPNSAREPAAARDIELHVLRAGMSFDLAAQE